MTISTSDHSNANPGGPHNELLQYVQIPTPQALIEKQQTASRLGKQIFFLQQCLDRLESTYTAGSEVWVYFDRSSHTLSRSQVDEVIAALAERKWQATPVDMNGPTARITITSQNHG
jgi:chromosome condensin MukBEF complex kleisin-like MukF subunit